MSSENSSWLDCYEEDNEYLKNVQLYNTCPHYPSNQLNLTTVKLKKIRTQKCFDEECFFRDLENLKENERREKRKLQTHILKTYKSNAEDNTRPLYPETSDFSSTYPKRPNGYEPVQPKFEYHPSTLFRRYLNTSIRKNFVVDRLLNVKSGDEKEDFEDILAYQSQSCRVLIYDNTNVIRKRCDTIMETQSIDYSQAISLFPPASHSNY